MKAVTITVAGILIGVIATAFDQLWVAGLSALAALYGAFLQYKDSVAFEFIFSKTDWTQIENSGQYYLEIPNSTHHKLNPVITVRDNDLHAEEFAYCNVHVLDNNLVRIETTFVFSGKAIIHNLNNITF